MSSVSGSSVTRLRFDVFDSVYRQLYTTLATTLMLDPKLCLHIMSLWIWMEKNGFIDSVENIRNLPLDLITGLADEAVLCINFFKNVIFPTPLELSNTIPLLHFLMKKELPLMFLSRNRGSFVRGMKKVHNDLCRDFEDLYREAKWSHEMSQLIRSFNDNVNVGSNLCPASSRLSDSSRIGCAPVAFNVERSESWNSSQSHLSSPPHNAARIGHDPVKVVLPGSPVSPHGYVGMGRSVQVPATHKPFHYTPTPRGPSLRSPGSMILNRVHPQPQQVRIRDTYVVIPAEDRTLFVTFSKGYRVHEQELMKYMTDWLGDCIEAIVMQEAARDEQPLYARIVFYYPETIDAILKGNERYKFSINGKHVWVRKYISKNQRNNS